MARRQAGLGTWLGARLDAAAAIMSPAWAARRAAGRALLYAFASGGYAGAIVNRLTSSWRTTTGSADQDLLPDLAALRERTRQLTRDDPHAAGAVQSVVDSVVGVGIRPQASVSAAAVGVTPAVAREWERRAERAWRRWEPWADAQDRMSVYEIESLVERQILVNGDVLVLPLRIEEPGRPYTPALEVIEADRLRTPSDKLGDRSIRDGVELGERGQPIAYWVRRHHPGDLTVGEWSYDDSSRAYMRIPARNRFGARNVYHLFWLKRAGQSRGEPWFAPVLNYFRDLASYLEAELVAARIAACFALLIKKTSPADGVVAMTNDTTADGKRLSQLEPGIIETLNTGEDVVQVNPARPGGNFDGFVTRVLRSIASGLGLTYEVLARDFSRTNFSSARAALLEARRFYQVRQAWHQARWLGDVYAAVVEEAYLRGEMLDLPARAVMDNWHEWSRARWIAQAQGWIDPVKEVQAAQMAINLGVSTLAEENAVQGRDWEETLEQRAREETERAALGLPPTPSTGGSAQAAPAIPAPARTALPPGAPTPEEPEEPEGEEEEAAAAAGSNPAPGSDLDGGLSSPVRK